MIDEPEEERSSWKRRGGIAVALALVALALGYGLYRVVHNASGPGRPVQEIVTLKLIQPPPPPPPPPQIPKPPEPQKMEQPQEQKPMQRVKTEQPKPPQQPLALDAKGGPGSDSFGLGGRPGGSDLIGGDGGGNGLGRFTPYANMALDQMMGALRKTIKLNGTFRAVVSVWLSSEGRPTRVKIVHSTGDRDLDKQIEEILTAMPALPQAPARDMPQPVDLVLNGRQP